MDKPLVSIKIGTLFFITLLNSAAAHSIPSDITATTTNYHNHLYTFTIEAPYSSAIYNLTNPNLDITNWL